MVIQWFPGHMTKALRMMEKEIKIVDAIIYVLDSRAPFSCVNPKFETLIGNKPIIYVFNKYDIVNKEILGDDYKVQDQYEQQETLYKMMKAEKLAVYLILTFVLIMATFNVIGSLSMLIIDKRKDINVLKALGADKKLIRKIFINEGLMISVVGGILGLIIGIIAVLIQQHFGIIRLGNGDGNYIIEAYPVALEMADVVLVFITIINSLIVAC